MTTLLLLLPPLPVSAAWRACGHILADAEYAVAVCLKDLLRAVVRSVRRHNRVCGCCVRQNCFPFLVARHVRVFVVVVGTSSNTCSITCIRIVEIAELVTVVELVFGITGTGVVAKSTTLLLLV